MSSALGLSLEGVEKRFGRTHALKPMSLDFAPGGIHALVGENGAGKSTCLGIAAGRISASAGRVCVQGIPLKHGDPRHARSLGVAAIYQELTIVPALSAQANVFLGRPLATAALLQEGAMRRQFLELCTRLEVSIQPQIRASSLSTAQQQMLEIMRALACDASVFLFDEPTSSLDEPERETLFSVMRGLRAAGRTVVLVSHNLDEVLAVSDTVTVFRDGSLVERGETATWTKRKLVKAMLGQASDDLLEQALLDGEAQTRPGAGAIHGGEEHRSRVVVNARINLPGRVKDVELDVREGEICGVAGLVGSGRSSLLRALAGLERQAHGELTVNGVTSRLPRNPREAIRRGFALIPEDRKRDGLLLAMSGADNMVMSSYSDVARAGVVRQRVLRARAQELSGAVALNPSRLRETASVLSGGNQQKLLVARWRHVRPTVLLADEPTRGVDIQAREEILESLRSLAAQGGSVLMVSSELEELVAVCDRVIVLAHGRLVGTIASGKDFHVRAILDMAFGVDERDNADLVPS